MTDEWYIREYRCSNGVCVKTKFPANGDAAPRAGTKSFERDERRAEKGATEARHDMALIANENFAAGRDCYLGLDYSDAALEELVMHAGTDERDELYLAAKKWCLKNYLKRCRRACAAAGVELKYLAVTSDMDGRTGEAVRVHHHMIVNREAAEICRSKWYAGGARLSTLYAAHHGDLTELVEYMINQVRYFPDEKRYSPSRNLRRPWVSPPRRSRNPMAELQVPRGCVLIHRYEGHAGRPQRVRYWRPPRE